MSDVIAAFQAVAILIAATILTVILVAASQIVSINKEK
jgi:hypothetical protein